MEAYRLDEVLQKYVEIGDNEAVTADEVMTFARENNAVAKNRNGMEEGFLVSLRGQLELLTESQLRHRLDPLSE